MVPPVLCVFRSIVRLHAWLCCYVVFNHKLFYPYCDAQRVEALLSTLSGYIAAEDVNALAFGMVPHDGWPPAEALARKLWQEFVDAVQVICDERPPVYAVFRPHDRTSASAARSACVNFVMFDCMLTGTLPARPSSAPHKPMITAPLPPRSFPTSVPVGRGQAPVRPAAPSLKRPLPRVKTPYDDDPEYVPGQ